MAKPTVNLDSNMVRFRPGHPFLIARLYRLANRRNVDLSDVAREGTNTFVDSEEKRLNLPPITPAEVASMRRRMHLNVALIAENATVPDYSLNGASVVPDEASPVGGNAGPTSDN